MSCYDIFLGIFHIFLVYFTPVGASQAALLVKYLPANNAGDVRDAGSIPGLGRSSGGGHGNPLQFFLFFFFLAWRILWTEEPGRLIVHGVAKSQT